MDWFLYDNGLRHERVKVHCTSELVLIVVVQLHYNETPRGGSRAAASFQPSTIITKRSILDVSAALDPPLIP